VLYHGTGESDQSRSDEASREAIKLAPELAEAHVSRGLFYVASGQYPEAEKMFARAIEIDEGMFEAHYQMARACVHQNKLEEALAWFEKAAALSPDDFQAPLISAPIYRSLGQYERALKEDRQGIENARRALEVHPDHARAYYLGAGALLHAGQKQEANEWAERALAIDSSDGSTLYNVACYYAQAGEADKAFECLDRGGIHAVTWMTNDPDMDPIKDDPRFEKILKRYGDVG
jgi:tetratricopeptide (TPR) repeat protein